MDNHYIYKIFVSSFKNLNLALTRNFSLISKKERKEKSTRSEEKEGRKEGVTNPRPTSKYYPTVMQIHPRYEIR